MHYHEFIHELRWVDIPVNTRHMARRCLLDLLGVAVSGTRTDLSAIIRDYVLSEHAAGTQGARILFDGRRCSASGAALAGGMTIDSVDAHDGYKPVKGHAGCGVLPALLALIESEYADNISEAELLTCLVIGYEIACRAGASLHESVSDYHTSGAWVAVAAAAIGARLLKLDQQQTSHALGIAEYHGPRSQMMRCIDHPTMLKDGSGWGSMAGVSAAMLARSGFTGAPAITVEENNVSHHWNDLGSRWLIDLQYFKPYPVCRWAQSAIVAAFKLQQDNGFDHSDIAQISIGSFHESVRLATANPTTTEQAQYSLPYPVAAALVKKQLTVEEIDGKALDDDAILSLSRAIELYEVDAFNQVFPERRISEVNITLRDGRKLTSGATEATGDPEIPLSDDAVNAKFIQYASPLLGQPQALAICEYIHQMGNATDLHQLNTFIYQPYNHQPGISV